MPLENHLFYTVMKRSLLFSFNFCVLDSKWNMLHFNASQCHDQIICFLVRTWRRRAPNSGGTGTSGSPCLRSTRTLRSSTATSVPLSSPTSPWTSWRNSAAGSTTPSPTSGTEMQWGTFMWVASAWHPLFIRFIWWLTRRLNPSETKLKSTYVNWYLIQYN